MNPVVTQLLKKWDLKFFYRVQDTEIPLVTNNQLNSVRIPKSFATCVYPYQCTLVYAQLFQVVPSIHFSS